MATFMMDGWMSNLAKKVSAVKKTLIKKTPAAVSSPSPVPTPQATLGPVLQQGAQIVQDIKPSIESLTDTTPKPEPELPKGKKGITGLVIFLAALAGGYLYLNRK